MPRIASGSSFLLACLTPITLFGLMLSLTACDDDDREDPHCTVDGDCDLGRVCAEVVGEDDLVCAAPVWIAGVVVAGEDDAPIEGARVLALGPNGAARSGVAYSDSAGRYRLPLPTPRDAAGRPIGDPATLRVDAAGRLPFAEAPRVALPVDPIEASGDDSVGYVIESPATTVRLYARAMRGATVSGRVDHGEAGGMLLLAEVGGRSRVTGIVELDGGFALYDVPTGEVTIVGYRAGLHVPAVVVEVPAGGRDDVLLMAESDTVGVVTGSVSVVNAPGGLTTSVVLVPDSAFDEETVRGPAVAGLRAAPVSGGFRIEGVPPGRYAVLAGFENDRLVRDPDTGIGGTEIVRVEVGPGAEVSAGMGFKVTEALRVVSPGATEVEVVSPGERALVWADDSSEDGYELRIYDAFGERVFVDLEVPRVTGSATVEVRWTPPLAGMLYQFRVASFREDRDGRRYISLTEDLRGVFRVAGP